LSFNAINVEQIKLSLLCHCRSIFSCVLQICASIVIKLLVMRQVGYNSEVLKHCTVKCVVKF